MISKKLVLILSLCVAGSLVPAYGAACAASGTLNTYVGTTCDIGAYTFHFVNWIPTGDAGSNPLGGEPSTAVTLTTVGNVNGTGFSLSPIGSASGGGYIDGELQYTVTGAGIHKIYQEIDGTVTPHGVDDISDNICLGSTGIPPGTPCLTTTGVAGGSVQQLHSTIITNGDTGSAGGITFRDHDNGVDNDGCAGGFAVAGGCANNLNFSGAAFDAVSSIALQKDIRADTHDGGTGASASISTIYNQFGPAVPEPSTYVLSFIGLGLMFLGTRKYSRS